MAVTTAARTLAGEGLRVLAVASRPAPDGASELDVDQLVAATSGLVFHGLVGLLDPPRNEVPAAIAVAVQAGIEVKMVTGDHLDTARAIASQIGIVGEAISGQDLDGLDDDQLAERIDHVGVIARVSPQHKVRIVRALRQRNAVVAMTGDGVNDAAALSVADIGVAMGISGTEVAKDAADMVLADDNFATITSAVEQGRTIYNNIIKFVRFQLATNIGALCALIGAQIVNLPVPFNPIQLLWINLIMDGPPAMALGVDPDTPGEMDHPPRGAGQQILSRRRLGEVAVQGLVMAAATLGVLAWADHRYGTERALTLAFTTFVLMQVVNALNVRDEQRSLFTRATLTNRSLYIALAGVVILQVLAVQLQVGQNVFGTTTLTFSDWAIATGLALTLALIEETTKAVRRRRPAPTQQP
jgi:Ca2+-transporting ATPase